VNEELERITQTLREKADAAGFAVLSVFGDEQTLPFSYTIGLARHGLPEIIVPSLAPEQAQAMLNDIGQRAIAGKLSLTPQGPIEGLIFGQAPGAFLAVSAGKHAEMLRTVGPVLDLAPGQWSAVQLIVRDQSGRFPWDAGCDPRARAAQDLGLVAFSLD